jgi:heme-degrading monooxygenase HmoA
MFLALWEYEVKSGSEEKFEEVYGADGAWARLFRRARGYRRTRLVRDAAKPRIYLTHDSWDSREEYEKFRMDFRTAYEAMDKIGDGLTVREMRIGYFEEVQLGSD